MEYNGFYIDENIGNNEFSFKDRVNKKIYIPPIIEVNAKKDKILNNINVSNKVAFSEIDENGKEKNIFGLENFVYTQKNSKKIYIFDNHNHCFYFVSSNIIKDFELKNNKCNQSSLLQYDENTSLSKECKNIKMDYIDITTLENFMKNNKKTMIHFDQHKDMRCPKLSLKEFSRMNKYKSFYDLIFSYTNYHLNVGNFIVPLKESGFISKVIIVDSNYSIDELEKNISNFNNIILDIDLDFFSKDMDYIDDYKKVNLISKAYEKADIITICTSPYFIEFQRAKKYLGIILEEFGL